MADDGAGFDAAAVMAAGDDEAMGENGRSSIGLHNVDERLRLLYGDNYRLQIESKPDEGTRVVFRIPSNSASVQVRK